MQHRGLPRDEEAEVQVVQQRMFHLMIGSSPWPRLDGFPIRGALPIDTREDPTEFLIAKELIKKSFGAREVVQESVFAGLAVQVELEEGSVNLMPPMDLLIPERSVRWGFFDHFEPCAPLMVKPVLRKFPSEFNPGLAILGLARLIRKPQKGKGRSQLRADRYRKPPVDRFRLELPLPVELIAEAQKPSVGTEHSFKTHVGQLFRVVDD